MRKRPLLLSGSAPAAAQAAAQSTHGSSMGFWGGAHLREGRPCGTTCIPEGGVGRSHVPHSLALERAVEHGWVSMETPHEAGAPAPG